MHLAQDEFAGTDYIHSTWIKCELAGDISGVLALCSDDIEFRPPDSPPLAGREAVLTYLSRNSTPVDKISISGSRIQVSENLAYLTANYTASFSGRNQQRSTVRGRHLWILRRYANNWLVNVVTWSVWKK